ncbi:MAG: YwhD family protein [Candidatus Omnitrophota bacterium]|nr:YwhD family protein [Candidatus Omnitrophota bacterium]
MAKPIPLTTGLGEVAAPGTLLTTLILSPDGAISVDPGALHGRSAIEQAIRFVPARDQLPNARCSWVIWVAVELDASNAPVRYKGLAVSELWVDPVAKAGYKVLAESVNRMSEALRGGLNLTGLDERARTLVRQQLMALSADLWERSARELKEALG